MTVTESEATVTAIRSIPEDDYPDEWHSLGYLALTWAAKYIQDPNQAEGTPWDLTDEQVKIILRWYEIDDAGRFVNRRGVLRRMKGWGKDPLAATLALIELCGPCRYNGREADNKPKARACAAPWIQIAAVSKTQTRNTMLLLPGMISKRMQTEYKIDIGKEIIYANGGRGQIQAVSSSPRALEGSRPTFAIINESHHWLHSNEGHEMADAIRRGLGKSSDGQARSLEITNAHLPDEDSVAELTYEGWRQAGYSLAGVMYDSVEAPDVPDLQDREALLAALRAARGDSVWLDVERLADEIQDPATPDGMARRFYLNQVTKLGGNWLPDGMWDEIAKPGVSIPNGSQVVLALDGSFNGDSTALVACSLAQPHHLSVIGHWEAPVENPYWKVNIADVEERVRECCRLYDVRDIVADPYRWQRSLENLEAEGLPVTEYPQSPSRMTPATTKLYEAVVNGIVSHDGNIALARHIQNAVLFTDSRGSRLRKETKGSPKKIDLVVTAVMAHDTATRLATEIDEAERCPDCGSELDKKLRCPVCAPQVFNMHDIIDSMRNERSSEETPQESLSPHGFVIPTVTQHYFS